MKTKTGKTMAPNASQRNWSSTGAPLLTTPTNGPGFTHAKPIGSIAASPDRIANSNSRTLYDGAELRYCPVGRPDHKDIPSRMSNRLHFPDGRVEVLA